MESKKAVFVSSLFAICIFISALNCSKFRQKKRLQRSSDCGEDEFRCETGQCISDTDICDGLAQCQDTSDETPELCKHIQCPSYTFRCEYGACIRHTDKCNGKTDCIDGSDEDQLLCNFTTPVHSCTLPNYPEFGKYTILKSNSSKPGEFVEEGTVLTIKCDEHHLPSSNATNITCRNKNWTSTLPDCISICSISSNIKAEVECLTNGIGNCEHIYSGTTVKFTCKPFYEDLNLIRDPFRQCNNGQWNKPLPQCTPVCGLKSNATLNDRKKIKSPPWQVAVYNKSSADKEQICGGSIVSLKTVLSAAHCFTLDDGRVISLDTFMIGVGKYFRAYNDTRDFDTAQYRNVIDIKIPDDYHGDDAKFKSDIAVLILNKKLQLNEYVQPVCLDWFGSHETIPDSQGIVTGWGNFSETLKEVEVSFKSYAQCVANIPKDFQEYLVPDKMCSGHIGRDNKICQGDSGGGLYFRSDDDRFYVQGIVSVSPRSGKTCNTKDYVLYTKVSYYNNFIQNVIAFE